MATATLTRRSRSGARPPGAPSLRDERDGPGQDPAWTRPAAFGLLALTGVLYLWNLAASGWANSYYAAAVQAGTQSWKAMFFGALDAGNLITVDKPPASLWVMEISARIFGFNAWSMLAPQALEGVAAVGLLYLTVKRWHGARTALVAGAALALTPVAALMFRFNNPDALLTLLLVASAYALTRAIEKAGARWLLLAGAAIGFAFLTKMLQGFLVLPGFALIYLIAAPTTFWRRVRQLLAAGAAVVISAGWWVATVELWPAASRPYVGGSTNNSVLELVLGYNGLSRLTGGQGNGGGGSGTAGSSFGGATGLSRLFSSDMGVDVAWLLPAALLSLVLVLIVRGRAPRTDRPRASALLWGTWLISTGLVLSYMQGTVHPYYTVALAPAVAALTAIGGEQLWRRRDALLARIALAAVVLAAGGMGYVILARNGDWYPVLRYAVLGVSVVSALGLVLARTSMRRTTAALLLAGTLAGLAGPGAYSIATAATTHSGSIPTAGPASAATSGMGGGMGGGGMRGGQGQPGQNSQSDTSSQSGRQGTPPSGGQAPGSASNGGTSSSSGSSSSGTSATSSSGTSSSGTSSSGTSSSGTSSSAEASGTTGGAPSGGGGAGTSTSSELTSMLTATTTTWSAATVGAQNAASLELASGTSVMGIGGWSGSDNAPTLAQFKAYVAAGKVKYFIASGTGQGGGPGGGSNAITSWVTSTFTSTTVGNTTVYDLTSKAA